MKKKHLLLLLFFPFALQLFFLFFLHFDTTFHPRCFQHGFDKSYSMEVSGLDSSKLKNILTQPFHYLGMGKQMVALESSDGQYVLKLFNPMRPLKRNWYLNWKYWKRYNSLKWISREWFHRKARLKKLFLRNKLSYELLKDETGLIYVYLAPSEAVPDTLNVTDRMGKNHTLALRKTPFVLQEKAVLVPRYLNALLEKNQISEAKAAIARLENMFENRIQKGIIDRIQTMENNYGFVGGKPIQIDFGRIRMDLNVKKNPLEEQTRVLQNFHEWLTQKYPQIK